VAAELALAEDENGRVGHVARTSLDDTA